MTDRQGKIILYIIIIIVILLSEMCADPYHKAGYFGK